MRVRKPSFSSKFKPAPEIKHDSRVLTGFGGVTVLSGYLLATGLVAGLRSRLNNVRKVGDYAAFSLVYLLLLFISLGGRRPGHLKYFGADGLLGRMAWLRRIPATSTISRFFIACGKEIVGYIGEANVDYVIGCLRRLGRQSLSVITLDVDGTVVSTRGHQGFASKGYNPIKKGARGSGSHHDPSAIDIKYPTISSYIGDRYQISLKNEGARWHCY